MDTAEIRGFYALAATNLPFVSGTSGTTTLIDKGSVPVLLLGGQHGFQSISPLRRNHRAISRQHLTLTPWISPAQANPLTLCQS